MVGTVSELGGLGGLLGRQVGVTVGRGSWSEVLVLYEDKVNTDSRSQQSTERT